MYFSKIRLINYRNFLDLNITFDRNINIFIGDNAQGKTNILEALSLITKGNSYRTNKEKQLINWDNQSTYLHTEINKKEEIYLIDLSLEKKIEELNKDKLVKTIKINNNFKKKGQLIKEFKGVVFSPEHLQIIKGSPSLRRKFLDEQISQIYPLYNRYLLQYYRILNQRNNILKSNINRREKKKNLILWNPKLIEYGAFLILTRIRFLKKISHMADKFHQEITKENNELNLIYHTNVFIKCEEKATDIKEKFKIKISECIDKEINYKSTLIGPHRDDFLIYINKTNITFYGSQGQQRTAILTLKLAEVDLIKEKEGVYPILFLDDVMSELDDRRRSFLLELIINKKVQTFITSINLNYFNKDIIKKGKIFKIKKGKASVL
ncbi:MAG: DNA replication/repair protein RecF [Candidatus Caldatribacteriota bacterium]|nr:DNA replication/repair protein RecF [Candidatus Caldatribacteriota bacterium]